ncbi:hypothetical protein B9Z19DRAFT_1099051 [Tuber borchii]|uniref:Phosphoadenosine phosphosulphate reductase domain-containing protein n=1 Tax=Tuber borchii TaxID=42251 RepID=A0A2T7A503_TUBBO|nr:hypothetical protein B9Z19DRAFT_1099051 [Tuber borchii]
MTVTPTEYPQRPIPERSMSQGEESGYDSPGSTTPCSPEVYFSSPHLKHLNEQLQTLEPEEILKWCMISLPNLYQTTAFGLTGLVTLDMLSRINAGGPRQIDLIFLDTLYHFDETLELVDKVRGRYPNTKLHIYKPDGCANARDFESIHGDNLWDTNDDLYDYLAKVEPAQRAYAELSVKAVLTGRRKSQGGKRGDLDIIEVDDAGLIKVNPLANWTFQQVRDPIAEGEDERSGRWKGTNKTECGIHNRRSKYAEYLLQEEQKKKEEAIADALRKVESQRAI